MLSAQTSLGAELTRHGSHVLVMLRCVALATHNPSKLEGCGSAAPTGDQARALLLALLDEAQRLLQLLLVDLQGDERAVVLCTISDTGRALAMGRGMRGSRHVQLEI
jgi:hypothetical protein